MATIKVYRVWIFVCLFFSILLLPMFACRADGGDYQRHLINLANERELYKHRYWDILLHYKSGPNGKESLIDDPHFFLSPNGKGDPKKELKDTLKGFFSPEIDQVTHPLCRFPARYAWLKEMLSIDEERLPGIRCNGLEQFLQKTSPKSAALIFPAATNTRLASMFGHTLLRIDSANKNKLLSYAVNYAALTRDRVGCAYAYKGIFGHYNGYYAMLPYYQKIREYNDLEDRDMWEYDLNLSEEEVVRMVLHIWELKEIYSEYYFFDENCSYNLLFLLEAARPSIDLTSRFWDTWSFWVIPTDTVYLIREAGLISKVTCRPSLATKIRYDATQLDSNMRDLVTDIVFQRVAPHQIIEMDLTVDNKRRILESATRCIQYQYSSMLLKPKEYQERIVKLARTKNDLGKTNLAPGHIPNLSSPDMGHMPGRVGIGFGYREDSPFTQIRLRPAYHGPDDPDQGYVDGSQLNILDVAGRYYNEGKSLKLEKFCLIDIVSLAPRDFFLKPISWKFKTGFERDIMPDGNAHLLYRINIGGGYSYRPFQAGILYGLLETDLNMTGRFQDKFSLGAGFTMGLAANLSQRLRLNLKGQAMIYELGESYRKYTGTLLQSVAITRNMGISLQIKMERAFGFQHLEMTTNINYYY